MPSPKVKPGAKLRALAGGPPRIPKGSHKENRGPHRVPKSNKASSVEAANLGVAGASEIAPVDDYLSLDALGHLVDSSGIGPEPALVNNDESDTASRVSDAKLDCTANLNSSDEDYEGADEPTIRPLAIHEADSERSNPTAPNDDDSYEPVVALAGDLLDFSDIRDTATLLRHAIEAILFVSEKPITLKELSKGLQLDKKRTLELLNELRSEYEARGIRIDEVADGYAFRTHPSIADYVRNFLEQRPVKLSRAQLETLSIVAYRQPITRPEVDDIRGVNCGPVLKGLLERDLVRILGKKDEPGRPMLYGTTPSFLELFGLKSLQELPTLREFAELNEDSKRKYQEEIGEGLPLGLADLGLLTEDSQSNTESNSGNQLTQTVARAREHNRIDPGEVIATSDGVVNPLDPVEFGPACSNDDEGDEGDEDERRGGRGRQRGRRRRRRRGRRGR